MDFMNLAGMTQYFNVTTCLMICYITLIDKKWIICSKTCYSLHFFPKPGNYTLNSYLFHFQLLTHLLDDNLSQDPNGLVRGLDQGNTATFYFPMTCVNCMAWLPVINIKSKIPRIWWKVSLLGLSDCIRFSNQRITKCNIHQQMPRNWVICNKN